MKKSVWLVALILLSVLSMALAGCGTPDLGTEDNPIVMSFVPSGDTQEIIASGDALAEMITEKTGLVVEATVGTDFAAVREAMGAGKAHIGWLNTFNYVLANEKYGVDVGLVTERYGATTYVGQINVRADSGITSPGRPQGQGDVLGGPQLDLGLHHPAHHAPGQWHRSRQRLCPDSGGRLSQQRDHAVYNGDCDVGASYR